MAKNNMKHKAKYTMKECEVHGLTEHRIVKTRDTTHPLCVKCASQWHRDHKRQRKLEAIEYLGGKCNECGGVFHPSVYDFHHVDPSTKTCSPHRALAWSWERLKTELDKCILLCSNCHRVCHHDEDSQSV